MLAALCRSGPAQPTADAPSPNPAANPEKNDARRAYEAALEAYRDQMRRIEQLYTRYQTADESEQEEINERLKPLVAEAKQKVNTMVDAALEAFQAAPMQDPEVANLLLSVAEHRVVGQGKGGGGDQYEAALPILEALVDAQHEQAVLPMWGVLAAVATNQFDKADKFAKLAIQRGAVQADPGESSEAKDTFALAFRYLQEKDRFRERWEKEKAIRDKEAKADDLPRVRLKLSAGEVVIELFEDQAPIATANFLSLVKSGFYDGVKFHRVIPRFMAQGGDPTGTGSGGPGYAIRCEVDAPDARDHFRGTLSMAHAGRDTGGSQFFLCFVPTDHLDGAHTAFGRVVEGVEVLGEIQVVEPQSGGPQPDRILEAEVIRDRGHEYDFQKLPGR
ncbi:peptidylprolyl isomerase [Botrimarina sp.]|uniref:peptidylprolyl isomerase n=1 Tax=Botrimarina sp. TaxID=2795802 RepID=UPI0032EF59F4